MHVVFEEQLARFRQSLAQIRRDKRLKILTTPQRVQAEVGTRRASDRAPNALASVSDHLVVELFVSNLRE